MLTALVSGWSTFTLYPNPGDQPAFQRVVADLAQFEGNALMLEVGAGAFHYQGVPLETGRDGTERLATQLFLHDVEALSLRRAPSAGDLLALFGAVAAEEGSLVEHGGIEGALDAAAVSSISVRRRRLLGAVADDATRDAERGRSGERTLDSGERSPLASQVELGTPAADVATDLLEQAGGDLDLAAKLFVDVFDELYHPDTGGPPTMQRIGDMLLPYLEGEEDTTPIVTLTEAFFCLPEDAQVRVFEQFLDTLDDGVHRLFVDQFSGEELRRLEARLDADQSAALLQYARGALDRPDGQLEDLLPPLRSAQEARQHRKEASDRIALKLTETDPARVAARRRVELAGDLEEANQEGRAWGVLRDLIGCEFRAHRFKRLLRIWAGRIGAAIRERDFPTALEGIRAIEEDPVYQPEQRGAVHSALGQLVSAELIESVLDGGEGEDRSAALEVITALGPAVVDRLVEQLASEESAGRRKILVETLGSMAERNLRHLVRRLDDPRWYVVRNMATVLGRSRRTDAAAPLRKLMAHDDYRVRAEALRALIPLKAADLTSVLIEALGDANERIRQSALAFLRQERPPVPDLVKVISTGNLDGDTAASLVKIIGRQATAEAREALQELASRKFAMRGNDRAARQAAKDELKRIGA